MKVLDRAEVLVELRFRSFNNSYAGKLTETQRDMLRRAMYKMLAEFEELGFPSIEERRDLKTMLDEITDYQCFPLINLRDEFIMYMPALSDEATFAMYEALLEVSGVG